MYIKESDMNDRLTEEWRKGYQRGAANRGSWDVDWDGKGSNPYPPESEQHKNWREGWLAGFSRF